MSKRQPLTPCDQTFIKKLNNQSCYGSGDLYLVSYAYSSSFHLVQVSFDFRRISSVVWELFSINCQKNTFFLDKKENFLMQLYYMFKYKMKVRINFERCRFCWGLFALIDETPPLFFACFVLFFFLNLFLQLSQVLISNFLL